MENKIGLTTITSEEYKKLIKKEMELDIAWDDYEELEEQYRLLKIELDAIEEELKKMILVITDNKERATYMDYEFSEYDLADRKEVVEYINKNYMKNGVLKFRKIEETKEEETNE